MTEITPEIIAAFRVAFPAFADETKWPDDVITSALCEAFPECGGRGWGSFVADDCQNFKRRGVFFYAAHWLTITYNGGAGATDPSDVDGSARLNMSSKSVGDESIQYRITSIEKTADDWLSQTLYGQQYVRLRKRAAMGARAV